MGIRVGVRVGARWRICPMPDFHSPSFDPELSNPGQHPSCGPDPSAVQRQLRRLSALPSRSWLNEEVASRLAAKLEPIRMDPTEWVDWSAWLGGGESLVAQRYPHARRWVVEPCAELAERSRLSARTSGGWLSRWWSGQPAVLTEPVKEPPWSVGGVQMLWANMTLHGVADLKAAMLAWHRHLAIGGFLMCSGLGPDTARELRQMYRELGWPLPTIDFIDMHDLGDELLQAGFADPVMDMERLTLTWATPEAMLDEIRTWGGNVARGRASGLRTPRWKQQLLDRIRERLGRPDGRIALTVELIYGHAIKPEPRVPVTPEARVTLEDMRRMVRKPGHP